MSQTGQNAPGSPKSADGSTIVHIFKETFTDYQCAVDFAANFIKTNYGGDKGMNTYEYAVIGYSSDGGKTFGLSPLVQGPARAGSVNPRVGLDGLPKGSILFFDIHSHPTGMNGKGQMQFSGYDPKGIAKEVYSGDVQFSTELFIEGWT